MTTMKTILLACLSISLLAAASASLTVQQKRVFAGDDFKVTFSVPSSSTEQIVRIIFEEQERDVSVPKTTSRFSENVSFKAPGPGEYTMSAKGESIQVIVEKPLLAVEEVHFENAEVAQGGTAGFTFTVKNVGEYMVYNVNYQLVVTKHPGRYIFDSSEQGLGNLKGGEEKTITEGIKAAQNAEGSTTVQVIVEYEFDGEKHYSKGQADLTVRSWPWLDWVIVLLFFGAVLIAMIEIASRLSTRNKKS